MAAGMEAPPPPRPTGYVGGDNLIYVYQSYHLADPTGSGSPGPLACNLTAQYLEPGGCGVLPAASHVTTRFTTNAPAFSSSNVDLWDSWHLPYKALLRDGSYGKYDTLDMEQSGFMLERVSALGFSFFILDQSNGMPAADGYVPWENARGVAALIARMNKQRVATGRTGLGYTFELGCCTNHAWDSDEALPGMEAQLRTVWQAFMNSTDAETATIAGNSAGANAADLAAGFYRHPTSGKPLIVIYTIPMFESRWGVWMASRPESYGHRFHIGYSDNTRNGSYGWMMQRNCDPSTYPYDAKTGCLLNASFDAGHLVDNDTMWTAPSFGRVEPADAKYPQPYAAYAARDIRWYRAGFEAAAAMCPSQLVVGCINDYSENQGFWPSTCAACETGDETQPDLFWNATVVGTALVQRRCGLEA